MAKAKDPSRPQARKPRGFPDKTAAILAAERKLLDAVCGVYRHWGFDPIDTGPFETVEALGKFLPDSDRPNEGVFALEDDDGSWMALRYDHTAPLARYVAEHRTNLPRPFRRYAAGPVWRNEKPGPFRFREFIQCDADSVGVAGPAADAEMIAIAAEAMAAAGAAPGEFVIRINSRMALDSVMLSARVEQDAQRGIVLRALDKYDRLGRQGVELLLGAGREDESGDFTKGAGLEPEQIKVLLDFAEARGASRADTLSALRPLLSGNEQGELALQEAIAIDELLTALEVGDEAAVFDPSIVRGLDYYTGPVFEAELLREFKSEDGKPVQFGSVGGGGRYDDLVARFTGETVPATGFSVGISRLAAALASEDEGVGIGPVVVLVMDRDRVGESSVMAAELRRAGIRAETYLGSSGMRAQMKYADRRGAPAVVIVGEDERARGVVTIKDLKAGAEAAASVEDNEAWRSERPGQFEAPRGEMAARIAEIVGRTG